jgi:hypothetical protein
MKKRWGAKTWLLGALAMLIAGVVLDASRLVIPDQKDLEQAARGRRAPRFKEGDLAPDFSLPDHTGKERRLSEVARGDTMLFFTCGCRSCMEVQTYVGMLRKKLGAKTPRMVNVSTMSPEGEASWLGRTNLPQIILYEAKDGPVMKQYQGHPCPRIYRLREDRTVAWIGPSPDGLPSLQVMGLAVAKNLGFKSLPADLGGPSQPPAPAHEEKAPDGQTPTSKKKSTRREHSAPHPHQTS